jgi:hypothetical protein
MHRWIASLAFLLALPASAAIPTLTVDSDDGGVALDLSAMTIRTTIRGHWRARSSS